MRTTDRLDAGDRLETGYRTDGRVPEAGTMAGIGVEDVAFETWSPTLPADMTKPSVRTNSVRGKARLYRPPYDPAVKRPAVVVLQGLGGPKSSREFDYGDWFARQGLVAMVPSSFDSRDHGDSDHTWRALRVTTAMLTADAFGCLAYLRAQPDVDPDCVVVMGFSYGGMVSVLAAYDQIRRYFLDGEPGFAGHVSYYGCSVPRMDDPTTTGAPVLVVLGGKDANVSIPRSREIVGDLQRGGSAVDLHVFDDAYHQWDSGETKREVFSLRRCHIRIDRQGRLRDEKTGRKLDGWLSRLVYLTANVSVRGYWIVRDAAATQASNALLLDFLKSLGCPTDAPRIRRDGDG